MNVANSVRRACQQRNYGNGGTVCVCNTTYCDDLEPVSKQDKGVAALYISSKSGDRLKYTLESFKTSLPNTNGITLRIDRSKKFQTILGFGGSFTDATGINIRSLPSELGLNIVKDYFSENGLEYSVCRIPIAGTDYSPRPYSYADVAGDKNLTYFSLQQEDFVYKVIYGTTVITMGPIIITKYLYDKNIFRFPIIRSHSLNMLNF